MCLLLTFVCVVGLCLCVSFVFVRFRVFCVCVTSRASFCAVSCVVFHFVLVSWLEKGPQNNHFVISTAKLHNFLQRKQIIY